MLQNPRKTLGFKKNMVYKIPPGGGGRPYPASGLYAGWAVDLRTLRFQHGYRRITVFKLFAKVISRRQ